MGTHFGKIVWLLSPSRAIIDQLKLGDQTHRGSALRKWSFWLFCIEALACVALMLFTSLISATIPSIVAGVLIVYASSRVNDIAYAFYKDALSRLNQEKQESDLSITDRMRMAMRSYFGLAFNFAVLFHVIPFAGLFKEPLRNFVESFYFSGVTLATLGYGDISPAHWISRLLTLYEVFTGILILAVAIAIYVGGSKGED